MRAYFCVGLECRIRGGGGMSAPEGGARVRCGGGDCADYMRADGCGDGRPDADGVTTEWPERSDSGHGRVPS